MNQEMPKTLQKNLTKFSFAKHDMRHCPAFSAWRFIGVSPGVRIRVILPSITT
jgi:hypothetical protein